MDVQRIKIKLHEIGLLLDELNEILPKSYEVYKASLKTRRAIERELQIIIETIIDVCFMIIKDLSLEIPKEESGIDYILEGIVPGIEKIAQMRSFRNILVHRYGKVDDRKVYLFAKDYSDDFYEFIENIEQIIRKHR